MLYVIIYNRIVIYRRDARIIFVKNKIRRSVAIHYVSLKNRCSNRSKQNPLVSFNYPLQLGVRNYFDEKFERKKKEKETIYRKVICHSSSSSSKVVTPREIHRRAIRLETHPSRWPSLASSSSEEISEKFIRRGNKPRWKVARHPFLLGDSWGGTQIGWPSWRPRCGRRLRGEKAPSHSRRGRRKRSNKSLSGHLRSRLTEASLIFPAFCGPPLLPPLFHRKPAIIMARVSSSSSSSSPSFFSPIN